jgi:tetratricopeptide (TPR) repeat protein
MGARIAMMIAVVAALAGAAIAQPRPPLDDATRARASAHVKQASAFFRTQQWDRAIAEYQAALDLTGEPLMIFNIALANDRAGRAELALAGYKKYLDLAPTGQIADEARDSVARLSPIVDKIAADRAASAARAAEAEAAASAARKAEADRQATAAAARAARAARAADADRADARASRLRWLALGAGVVGVAGVGVGVKFGLDARSASQFISDHRGNWTDDVLARDAEGRSAETKMIIFTSVGGAALVGGGILYLMSRSARGNAERMRLDVGPGTVALTGRF